MKKSGVIVLCVVAILVVSATGLLVYAASGLIQMVTAEADEQPIVAVADSLEEDSQSIASFPPAMGTQYSAGNPPEQSRPSHRVFSMRGEEEANMYFITDLGGGYVTFQEFSYLHYLAEENIDALEDLVQDRYAGTIADALTEKYGLPSDAIIPPAPNFDEDGNYTPPPLMEGLSPEVNHGRVDKNDIKID